MANGLALGLPTHSLSIQFSSILPLASSHLENGDAAHLSQEATGCLRIILSPSPLRHIPSGPLSSRSTELLLIVTGPTEQCITVSQIPLYCKGFISLKKKVINVLLWSSQNTTLQYMYVQNVMLI